MFNTRKRKIIFLAALLWVIGLGASQLHWLSDNANAYSGAAFTNLLETKAGEEPTQQEYLHAIITEIESYMFVIGEAYLIAYYWVILGLIPFVIIIGIMWITADKEPKN